ncbi:MAG: GTP-dependent dephospho-CoA kinase family protein [Haloarculaceae archaeon]
MTDDASDSDADAPSPDAAAPDVVLELQRSLRGELKEPFGPIYTDADALLAEAGAPLIAVGDVVTYHLINAGRVPEVALVDGRTKRSAVDDEVEAAVDGDTFDRQVAVANPPATLSAPLLEALADALEAPGTTAIVVEGEEDLAALPAIAAAPAGAGVVYGQPDEGMVLVTCDGETVTAVRDLLERMDGDAERLFSLLSAD